MPNSPQSPAPKKLKRVVGEKTGALSPDDSIQTAGDRMRSAEANAWPVAEGRKLVGTIDHPDPDRQAGGRGHDPRTTRVGDTMRHEAVFCYEDQDAAEAERIMEEHHLNHLPVVDREMRIVGIISRGDVKAAKSCGDAEEPATVEDWKPGEARSRGADRQRLDAEHRIDGDDDDATERDAALDAERFPFRAPVDAAEVS